MKNFLVLAFLSFFSLVTFASEPELYSADESISIIQSTTELQSMFYFDVDQHIKNAVEEELQSSWERISIRKDALNNYFLVAFSNDEDIVGAISLKLEDKDGNRDQNPCGPCGQGVSPLLYDVYFGGNHICVICDSRG